MGYLVDSSRYNMLWLGACRTTPESLSSWKLDPRQRRRAASVLLKLRWTAACSRRSRPTRCPYKTTAEAAWAGDRTHKM